MFKRFVEVFICGPIFIIGILLNIIFVITAIIWGPIYYIITGKDPLEEENVFFFYSVADKITFFILKRF